MGKIRGERLQEADTKIWEKKLLLVLITTDRRQTSTLRQVSIVAESVSFPATLVIKNIVS